MEAETKSRPSRSSRSRMTTSSVIISLVFVAGVAILLTWLALKQTYPHKPPAPPACLTPAFVRDTVHSLRFHSPTDLRTATGVCVIEPFGFCSATHSRKTLLRTAFPTKLLAQHNTLIPLDMDEGVYWINMQFPGGQSARAVVDTGSSNLVIGSQRCRRCPLHKNGVVAHPQKEDIHDADVNIAYGSQRVHTDVTMNTMNIQGLELDSDLSRDLLQNADAVVAHTESTLAPLQDAVKVHTEVFMMKHVEGATAANVFGIAPSPSHARRPSLLSLLQPEQPRFGLMLGSRGGALTLGPPPQTSGNSMRVVHVPLERPRHLQHTSTLFFMTRLEDILVGPSLASMRSVFAHVGGMRRPLWAMFDSGSTATFTSRGLRDPLRLAQQAAGTYTPFVSLVLPNNVHFVLSPSAYVWNGESTLEMETSFVNDLLRVEGVLVGCMASRGIFMDHDVAGQQLGFAAMHRDFVTIE